MIFRRTVLFALGRIDSRTDHCQQKTEIHVTDVKKDAMTVNDMRALMPQAPCAVCSALALLEPS